MIEQIEQNIKEKTQPYLNRAQRRALIKHARGFNGEEIDSILNAAKKLSYIQIIQKLRELNKLKENDENEQATED